MKIFQNIQKNWAKEGFGADQSSFNNMNIRHLFIFLSAIILQFAYLFHEAKSLEEYMLCIFMLVAEVSIFIDFLNTVFKKAQIFQLIDDLQTLTDESE